MTRFKSFLDDYLKKADATDTYGDNNKGATNGYGTNKCKFFEFNNVSYVKGLQNNLTSISQLCDIHYEVHFNKKEGKVIDKKEVIILTANHQVDIYTLEMFSTDNSRRRCFFSRSLYHLNWL